MTKRNPDKVSIEGVVRNPWSNTVHVLLKSKGHLCLLGSPYFEKLPYQNPKALPHEPQRAKAQNIFPAKTPLGFRA